MEMQWAFATRGVKAAMTIQAVFRANRAKKATQRFSKVMTRKLKICVPDGKECEGDILGELVLRCVWQQTDPAQLVKLGEGEGFEACPDGFAMLRDHGAGKNVDWHAEYYAKDPNYLLNGTVFKAPPLKRMMHVYGTGLDTCWSFIYRSLNGVEIKEGGPCSLGVELDPTADHLGDMNYKLKDGFLYETNHTLQRMPDEPDTTVRNSGDGTVPYQSLRYPATWDSPTFQSQSIELTGKEHEHREILSSKTFHNTLTEYLTETVSIYVIEAKDLKPMDRNGLADPYCALFATGPAIKRSQEKRKTRTFYKTLHPVFNERHVFGTEFDLGNIESIVIDVMDYDSASSDDIIGRLKIDLSEIEQSPTKALNGWCPLRDPKTGKGGLGVIHIHAELEGAGQSSMGVPDNMAKAAGCRPLSKVGGHERQWEDADVDEADDALLGVDLFRGLRPNEQSALKAALKRRVFHHGERMIEQGALSSDFYLIEDGLCEVSVSSLGEEGHLVEEVVGTMTGGQHFGEMALLPGDPKPRTASVTAMTTVECLSLSRDAFNAITHAQLASATVHVGGLHAVSKRKAKDEAAVVARMAEFGEVITAVVRYRDDEETSWALVSFVSPESVNKLMSGAEMDETGKHVARVSSCFPEQEEALYVARIDLAMAMASTGALPVIFQESRDRIARVRGKGA